jgi:hypothetical protein
MARLAPNFRKPGTAAQLNVIQYSSYQALHLIPLITPYSPLGHSVLGFPRASAATQHMHTMRTRPTRTPSPELFTFPRPCQSPSMAIHLFKTPNLVVFQQGLCILRFLASWSAYLLFPGGIVVAQGGRPIPGSAGLRDHLTTSYLNG